MPRPVSMNDIDILSTADSNGDLSGEETLDPALLTVPQLPATGEALPPHGNESVADAGADATGEETLDPARLLTVPQLPATGEALSPHGNESVADAGADATAAANDSDEPRKKKCQVRGCPGLYDHPGHEMEECGVPGCGKLVHSLCYSNIIQKSKKCGGSGPVEGKVFCTVKDHQKYLQSMKDDNFTWSNDGAEGKSDPKHSQYYLIEWLATGDNYSKWRSPPGSMTKLALATKLADEIYSKGVKVKRSGDTVSAKIGAIETCFKEAHSFKNSLTGIGLQEQDEELGITTFPDKIRSICPYYYDLEEKFVCRAGINPPLLSDQLLGEHGLKTTGLFSSEESDNNSNEGDNDNNNDAFSTNGDEITNDDVTTPPHSTHKNTHSLSASRSQSSSKKKKKKKTATSGKGDDSASNLDQLIATLARDQIRANKQKNTALMDQVEKAEQFKRMSDALGSKIRAAYHCKEFVVFLDRNEKHELEIYKLEQEGDDSE